LPGHHGRLNSVLSGLSSSALFSGTARTRIPPASRRPRVLLPLPKAGIRVIAEFPQPDGHQVRKDLVHGTYHPAPGAEVFLEEHPAGLALRGILTAVPQQFIQKNAGLRQAEAVYALFYVPHHKQVAALPGDCPEQAVLNLAHVLIFVHQYFCVAPGQRPRECRRLPGTLILQDAQGQVLQVGEVQQSQPPLLGGKGGVQLLR
jgi:hypothetical protein